eukprot:m.38623 g.38623  ORF g.38623 m.38623 type:complete len:333 (-) comp10230_c0_seq1:744-1742(-)
MSARISGKPLLFVGVLLMSLYACINEIACEETNESPPHIIFFLTDDLGWNAPSFHNPAVQTPTIQALYESGVELTSHYTYKYCSPTRGSFLSGRFPFKLAATRANMNPATVKDGLHLSYTTIADKLKQANYSTHQFGKWHQGFFNTSYIPQSRGFDSSFGFLTGGQDHWSEKTITYNAGIDIWNTDRNEYGVNGTWSGELYGKAAVDVIEKNAHLRSEQGTAPPLFLYVALHNTHGPTQAPLRHINRYNFTGPAGAMKNVFYGMISAVDETVKNVTDALKEHNMWNNSLIVWTSVTLHLCVVRVESSINNNNLYLLTLTCMILVRFCFSCCV